MLNLQCSVYELRIGIRSLKREGPGFPRIGSGLGLAKGEIDLP